jgi:hypothetical protein
VARPFFILHCHSKEGGVKVSLIMIRYFKKLAPGTPVVVNGNIPIKFDTLDGLTGYYATQEEGISEQFVSYMRQQRYGMTEISEQEFQENYVQKKMKSPAGTAPQKWREEMSGSSVLPKGYDPVSALPSEVVKHAVAVEGNDIRREPPIRMDDRPATFSPAKPLDGTMPAGSEPAKAEFKPTIGKRKKAPK